jgi:hypothetical protein
VLGGTVGAEVAARAGLVASAVPAKRVIIDFLLADVMDSFIFLLNCVVSSMV